MEKSFTLISETGLHARPATQFVMFINELPIDVWIVHKDFVADAKSIMAVMSLGLAKGASFNIRILDEHQAYLDKIETYLKEHGFIAS
ncbi:MAG: HPr family phosphocarrier protein [Acholeplasmataceae bacterium]